jgi:hypothetical protein
MGSSAPAQGNNRRNIIIGVVVAVVVLCCCCALIAIGAFWFCGDLITGVSQSCSF